MSSNRKMPHEYVKKTEISSEWVFKDILATFKAIQRDFLEALNHYNFNQNT